MTTHHDPFQRISDERGQQDTSYCCKTPSDIPKTQPLLLTQITSVQSRRSSRLQSIHIVVTTYLHRHQLQAVVLSKASEMVLAMVITISTQHGHCHPLSSGLPSATVLQLSILLHLKAPTVL